MRLKQDAVGRSLVTGIQHHHITDYNILTGNLLHLTVTYDGNHYIIIDSVQYLERTGSLNLKEETYNEIESMICDAFGDVEQSDSVKIFKKEKRLKVVLMSKNEEEFNNLFERHKELFDKIDSLIQD